MSVQCGMIKSLPCLASVLFALSLPSCVSVPGSALPPAAAQVAKTSAHLILSTKEMQPALIKEQADVAVRAPRWWRAGDGSAALRLVDSRGHTLRGVECGGILFVAGKAGEACKLQINNELDKSFEADVTANGEAPQHVEIAPRTIKEVAVKFEPVSGIEALHRFDLGAQRGGVGIKIFPSDKPVPLMPVRYTKLPVPGPQMRQYQPRMSPFQYR